MTETEQKILMMISSSGESKAKAFEALNQVAEGQYDKARALLKELIWKRIKFRHN